MTIGPAPMMRIEDMSVRLGIDCELPGIARVTDPLAPFRGRGRLVQSRAGRGGSAAAHRNEARAKELRRTSPNRTPSLVPPPGEPPRRQFPAAGLLPPYIADFASRSERLVIELDGDHAWRQEAYDAGSNTSARTARLPSAPLYDADVMTNLDGVLRTILIALGRTNPLHPSGGEGKARSARSGSR